MKKYIVALSLFLSLPAFAQNYQATQGAGTTFGTKLVGGVNYPQMTMCDPTTPAQCMAVDASGRVNVLQGTSPWVVSNGGTFAVQAAQSGTWTVQPGNTANTTAWLVTGTGGTFPATQSGTWTTRVVGNAGAIFDGATAAAVPANVLYNGINIGGNLAGLTGLATGATVKAATVAIVDASGNQITAFGGSGGTASNFGSAFPSSGTAVGFTDGTNMQPGRLKAASTAPAATDPSIVVTTSPNSPDATFLGAQADSVCGTATGTCTLAALVKFLNSAATSPTPAGTNAIGDTGTSYRSAKLSSAVINFASSGDNIVVTRAVGTIKVYMMSYVCASAVTQTIKNGTGTALSGAMPNVTTSFLPYNGGEPYYTTTSTNNFVINLGSAVSCQGTVWYIDS